MLSEPAITIMGNLADTPELRYTPAGVPVARFTIAANPRTRNSTTGEWENGTPIFLRVTAWRDLAENICQSLKRGDPALIVGRLRQNSWEDKETGANRRADEITADTVAVPLDRRVVHMVKVTRDRAESDSPGPDSGGTAEPAGEPASPGAAEPATDAAGSAGSPRGRKGAHARSRSAS